jgi:hypothetical protein
MVKADDLEFYIFSSECQTSLPSTSLPSALADGKERKIPNWL